ncbi:MAG: NAD(P)-binding protein [Spirochaetaceae bacterium]|nr:NAD(P)-binding protein [Myxococcales bacterium]MCB9725150.1 NAD(P)-binding protein [Spirochaetaceae bacterium]
MRIAVIGAGIAGATVASRLHAAGVEVEVFEKARGPSGRMSTRRTEHGDFDHGAQYFTARHPVFRATVADWIARGLVAPWDACIVTVEDGIVEVESDPPTRYVGVPRMSVLARDLIGPVALRTGVRIASLARAASSWSLQDEGGSSWGPYDACVLAVPAPQAVPLLEASPALARRAAAASLAPCHATLVRFEDKLPVPFDAAFVRHSPLAWIARNESKPGRSGAHVWVLHSTPEYSLGRLEAEPAEVSQDLLRALSRAVCGALPEVAFATTHRWLHARAESGRGTSPDLDREAGLGVCGDWTLGDRVEDAFLSGDLLFGVMRDAWGL